MIERLPVAMALALASAGPAWARAPAPHASFAALPNGAQVSNGALTLHVTALTDSILRVRVAPREGFAEDASWAVPAAVRRQVVPVRPTADGFATANIVRHFDPSTLRMTGTDAGGKVLIDGPPLAVSGDGQRFSLRKALPVGQHIYGMGDKTGTFDRRGESFVNWNT